MSWIGGWAALPGSRWWGFCSASRRVSSISSARRACSAARGGRVRVTAPSDLARGVWCVAGVLALGLAVLCGVLLSPADAAGVLVGSALSLVNFGALTWAANRAMGRGDAGSWPRVMWIGTGGLRLAVLGGLAVLAVQAIGVGIPGLLLSLTLVPVAVVLIGLRTARVA